MCNLSTESKALEDLRIIDFERTQLLTLSLEIKAIDLPLVPRQHRLSEEQPALIWHNTRKWYQILWLSLYPFFLWLFDFAGVIRTGLKNPRRVFRLRLDLVKWIFLVILAPIIGFVSVLWNVVYYTCPEVVYYIMTFGAPQVLRQGMIQNVDSQQALLELQNGVTDVYSQAVAEFLCLISASTYARSASTYARAEAIYRKLVAIEGQYLPSKPVLDDHPKEKKQILQIIHESEQVMREYGDAVGLETAVISELDTGLGGPTAAMFVSKKHHVIVIGISGTNPFDAREILVDAAFDKVIASPDHFAFLKRSRPAYLHRGFYSALFSLTPASTYPAKRIREAIIAQAKQMHQSNHSQGKVNVYITGHSLGAATASILASSLTDLGAEAQLCSAYVYGAPMSSDAAFCLDYANGKSPLHIWRVIDDGDIVTKIPPSIDNLSSDGGIGEMRDTSKILDGSILDYSAIGLGVRYHRTAHRPDGLAGVKTVCNVKADGRPISVWWVTLLQYTPLKDLIQHSTIAYSANLRRARSAMI